MMATYGKKRSKLPGFAVFQDDQPRPTTSSKLSGKSSAILLRPPSLIAFCPAPTRIGRAKTVLQRSKNRVTPDDDSIDELAADALLLNPVQQPMRSSFQSVQSDVLMPAPLRPKSSNATENALDKPLPPIPISEHEDYATTRRDKAALTIKTTNLKIPVQTEKPPLRPKISNPVLQNSEENDNNTALRLVNGFREDTSDKAPLTTTKDAELLNKKITDLMQQASAREVQPTPKKKSKHVKAEFISKPSPLQRGKNAFSKATRAIAGRLNSGRRPTTPNVRRPGPIESSPNSFIALEYHPESQKRSATIERRIAEGENLSNSKIQSIIGDGSIPRKPLPVYESMKSRRSSADSLENPFSDGNQAESIMSAEAQADVDFGFGFNKHKGKAKQRSRQPFPFEDTEPEVNIKASIDAPPPLNFSNKISGLAQHPDVSAFSSSPIGSSTPRIRLDPDLNFHEQKKAPATLKRSPSILEFSFEESDEDAISAEPKTSNASEPSGSIKRKSAKGDLRSQLSPTAAKRLRRSSDASGDDLALEHGFRQLGTNDTNVLMEKNKNARLAQPSTADSKTKGLSIFETAKRKVPLTSAAALATRPRVQRTVSGRSSIPRPNSILFSRESRAHYRLRDTTDGDTMEIDELQMYDDCDSIRRTEKR